MNHTFVAAPWNKSVCLTCAQTEPVHADNYQCEACNNQTGVTQVGKLLLCDDCAKKDLEVKPTETAADVKERLSLDQILVQVDRLVDGEQIKSMNGDSVKSMIDEAIKGDIKAYTDFFNAKMPSIMELKELIDNDETINEKQYALMAALRKRVSYLARVLFQVKSGEVEIAGEIKSIQHYMQKTIPELRMKLRAEFAANTPNYTPQVIKTSQAKTRKSRNPEERLAENYAKAMKITVEEALKIIRNKMRDDCTCSTTPGMCKVHNNISQTKQG